MVQVSGAGAHFIWIAIAAAIAKMIELERENNAGRKYKNGPDHVSHVGTGFGGFDRRIKQEIREEGRIEALDLTIYSWEYKIAAGERFVGVMAQDLLARPDLAAAISTFKDGPFEGFYRADYAALGLRCLHAEAWDGNVASLIVREDARVS
jgi:hypothetical protein